MEGLLRALRLAARLGLLLRGEEARLLEPLLGARDAQPRVLESLARLRRVHLVRVRVRVRVRVTVRVRVRVTVTVRLGTVGVADEARVDEPRHHAVDAHQATEACDPEALRHDQLDLEI